METGQSPTPNEMIQRKRALWEKLESVRLDPARPLAQRMEAMRRQDVLTAPLNKPPKDSNS